MATGGARAAGRRGAGLPGAAGASARRGARRVGASERVVGRRRGEQHGAAKRGCDPELGGGATARRARRGPGGGRGARTRGGRRRPGSDALRGQRRRGAQGRTYRRRMRGGDSMGQRAGGGAWPMVIIGHGDFRKRHATQSALARSTPILTLLQDPGEGMGNSERAVQHSGRRQTCPTRSFCLSLRPHYLRERMWARVSSRRGSILCPRFCSRFCSRAARARVAFNNRGRWSGTALAARETPRAPIGIGISSGTLTLRFPAHKSRAGASKSGGREIRRRRGPW